MTYCDSARTRVINPIVWKFIKITVLTKSRFHSVINPSKSSFKFLQGMSQCRFHKTNVKFTPQQCSPYTKNAATKSKGRQRQISNLSILLLVIKSQTPMITIIKSCDKSPPQIKTPQRCNNYRLQFGPSRPH